MSTNWYFVSVSDLITYPESRYAFLTGSAAQTVQEHTFQLAGQGAQWDGAIPSLCEREAARP